MIYVYKYVYACTEKCEVHWIPGVPASAPGASDQAAASPSVFVSLLDHVSASG
jgi:hypothetical protein